MKSASWVHPSLHTASWEFRAEMGNVLHGSSGHTGVSQTNKFFLTKLNENKDLAKKGPWFSSVARLISSFRQEKMNFLFSK